MSEVLQSTKEIELIFADLSQNILSMQDDQVLLMYRERGQSSYDINKDVLYISANLEYDERNSFKNRNYTYNGIEDKFDVSQQSSRTLYIKFIFYGPNCSENCFRLLENFFFEDIRDQLRLNNLNIIPERTYGPVNSREMKNSRWYKRCDMNVYFYNTISVETKANYFESTNIEIKFDR